MPKRLSKPAAAAGKRLAPAPDWDIPPGPLGPRLRAVGSSCGSVSGSGRGEEMPFFLLYHRSSSRARASKIARPATPPTTPPTTADCSGLRPRFVVLAAVDEDAGAELVAPPPNPPPMPAVPEASVPVAVAVTVAEPEDVNEPEIVLESSELVEAVKLEISVEALELDPVNEDRRREVVDEEDDVEIEDDGDELAVSEKDEDPVVEVTIEVPFDMKELNACALTRAVSVLVKPISVSI